MRKKLYFAAIVLLVALSFVLGFKVGKDTSVFFGFLTWLLLTLFAAKLQRVISNRKY